MVAEGGRLPSCFRLPLLVRQFLVTIEEAGERSRLRRQRNGQLCSGDWSRSRLEAGLEVA
jgi:hypothetical protein